MMNRRLFAHCFAASCLLMLPAASTAQKGTLSPETIKKIEAGVESERKRQKTKDGKETGYALGWSIGQTAEGMRLVMRNGNQAGARSELSLLPVKGSVIAIMANLSDVPLNEVLRVIGREVIAVVRE